MEADDGVVLMWRLMLYADDRVDVEADDGADMEADDGVDVEADVVG